MDRIGQGGRHSFATRVLRPRAYASGRDLPVAHVQRTHEGSEMASRVRRQVSHKATSLVPSIRGFVCLANQTEEPQASCSCWKSQPLRW